MNINLEDILKEEVNKLTASLEGQITDPVQKAAIVRVTTDLAMIPVRMARGEDVTHIVNSLKAEVALRGVTGSMKAQAAMQQAWMNVIIRIVTAVLLA